MASQYGAKCKFDKVEKISSQLKEKFSSLQKASKQFPDLPWKTVHKIFNPKISHEKRRVNKSNTEHVHNVLKSASCSVQLPSKKHSKLYFLTQSLIETYAEYMKVMKKKKRVLAFSAFSKERPKCVRLQQQLWINQCGCDRCINFKHGRSSLATNGVKGVPGRATECVINSLCPVEGKPLDILKYKCECIFEDCNTCSKPEVIFQQILKGAENKDLRRKCSWGHWKTTTKTINSKECSAFERPKVWGMLEELINQSVCDVLQMCQHLFHLERQWLQYGELVDILRRERLSL